MLLHKFISEKKFPLLSHSLLIYMSVDVHNSSSGIPRIKAVVFASLVCISANVHIQVHVVEHNHATIHRRN